MSDITDVVDAADVTDIADAADAVRENRPTGPHRRRVLRGAGLLGFGGGVAIGGGLGGVMALDSGVTVAAERSREDQSGGPDRVAVVRREALAGVVGDGRHQPGIADRPPAQLVFTAYDLTTSGPAAVRASLAAVLRTWTAAAAVLMRGEPLDGAERDTQGLGPAGLTITIGLGASALRRAGLDAQIPAELADIPAMPGDQLDPARSGGDLGVQVCAEDPMVAVSASRQIRRLAAQDARPRWIQRGFLRSAAAAFNPGSTPRNLMGQIDGTDNPGPGTPQFGRAVWVSNGPEWVRDGSYLVCRRIRMLLDAWARLDETAQSAVIGRRKSDGTALSAPPVGQGGAETIQPDFTARAADGSLAIAGNAHARLSHPSFHGGIAMLRRGYSYDDGLDSAGEPDAGLFFTAYQADPRTAFVAVQRTLAAGDALNTFIRHTSSALFAVPPAAPAGGFPAQGLFGAG
ncbi:MULTISPECIES: Dyp-type peroxidase [unclassified Frankia]